MEKVHSLLVLSLSISLFSAVNWANPNDFATLQANGNIVSWSIASDVHYQSIQVKLASGEKIISVTSEGEPITPPLEDGGYQYELTVTPLLSKAAKAELKAIRAEANGQEARNNVSELTRQGILPEAKIQSGYFTIDNGQLVMPQTE
ncbi:hypothetical protein [Methylocucumis oryzae]|uniref:Uncharacterized protein n=1 Tax=Methylocucumis oryzae TaxID=1632867 RepID=A0A0F3IF86_9GAMM|nr:hypothetical protein [Methylocucumis oryzae]KJV05347.1 hypothetical protein VZ94_18865 [Methylocucumis oryzae]